MRLNANLIMTGSITPKDWAKLTERQQIRYRKKARAMGGVIHNFMLAGAAPVAIEPETQETEKQRFDRIESRFKVLDMMASATALGANRAMIVSGPPGLGKSFGIHKILRELEEKGLRYRVIKGFVRATGLYKTLYDFKDPDCVVVFDDADSVMFDDTALNLLKSACDTTDIRELSWLAETTMEDEEGERLPRNFEFEGSVIFITNYDFDAAIQKGHKLAPHFEAMISRCHYLDLSLKSRADYIVRIKQVVGYGMLRDAGYTAKIETEVVQFIIANQDRLRELSLRMVLKVANLTKIDPANWQSTARITCFRG
jgi:hypothetical protein